MHSSVSPKLVVLVFCVCLALFPCDGFAKRRAPAGGKLAVVVDERLSAVRTTPELSGKLIRRMGRGSFVAVKNEKRSRDNVNFYRVNINSKTSGWIQREAVVSPTHAGDDSRLRLAARSTAAGAARDREESADGQSDHAGGFAGAGAAPGLQR